MFLVQEVFCETVMRCEGQIWELVGFSDLIGQPKVNISGLDMYICAIGIYVDSRGVLKTKI